MEKCFKYFWTKLSASVPIGIFVLDEQQYTVIYALLLMVIIDTFLGMWVAVKFKTFNSWNLGRVAGKIGRYAMALGSVWIISCFNPTLFGWTFSAFGTFFILTELFSNFEKLSLLGLKMPTHLLARLNQDFRKIDDDNGEKDEAIWKEQSRNKRNTRWITYKEKTLGFNFLDKYKNQEKRKRYVREYERRNKKKRKRYLREYRKKNRKRIYQQHKEWLKKTGKKYYKSKE